MSGTLDQTFRTHGGRVIAALAARFRDLDLAEDAFAEACARAADRWPHNEPADPAAWLYAVATRWALDRLRRRSVAAVHRPDPALPEPTPEDRMLEIDIPIPDERLRLIFVCCHPAVAADARAALTLKVVCGLSTQQIAAAFLVPEPTLAQRLVRAKRKIAEAGVPFEVPAAERWSDRLDAVLSTLEIAYAQAHADAALAGPHAAFAEDVLNLTGLLAELIPNEPEVLALAATVRLAEARRPARLDARGAFLPLVEQDVSLWSGPRISQGEAYLQKSATLSASMGQPPGPRALQAAIHAAHATRRITGKTPWRTITDLYDALLRHRDDAVVRTNRAVAIAEAEGAQAGLAALEGIEAPGWVPLMVARADLFDRLGRSSESRALFEAALDQAPPPAERLWLEGRIAALSQNEGSANQSA